MKMSCISLQSWMCLMSFLALKKDTRWHKVSMSSLKTVYKSYHVSPDTPTTTTLPLVVTFGRPHVIFLWIFLKILLDVCVVHSEWCQQQASARHSAIQRMDMPVLRDVELSFSWNWNRWFQSQLFFKGFSIHKYIWHR